MADSHETRILQLRASIAVLEAQRASLGSSVDPALELLRRELATLEQGLPASTPDGAARLADLHRAAPRSLARKILSSRVEGEGQRKPVTILFTDIVGSTSLAEKMDAEEWKEVVSGAHRRVSEAVYRYEGTIAQLLGDGVLAFFGAPITHEDDPIRAVRAALDIQQAVRAYAAELAGYIEKFEMRIGIHTGTVVVGTVGDDLHMEYLAIGDAVNLAARLQAAAKPGGILISSDTARLVRALAELNPLGEIAVKGKAEPIAVWEVTGIRATPGRRRGIEGLTSPLVGRERELESLFESLRELRQGRGQIVAVLGEAGIGKTRLVEEARSRAGEGVRWLEGRALSYGQTLSFWPIVQLLRSDLGLSDADPEPKVQVALRRRMRELFSLKRTDEVHPYLAHLLGVQGETGAVDQVRALDRETLKRQVLASVADYVAALAQHEPVVLVFEDFHWADPSTVEAVDRIFTVIARSPLMVILLMREEKDRAPWRLRELAAGEYRNRYLEHRLSPLTSNESNDLVDGLLATDALPDSLRALVLRRSDGNPLYLEEVIRSLIEQGVLTIVDGRWQATGASSAATIPETLQGVLLARIDRLQDDVRATLQLASVIGKTFLYQLLQAVALAERELDWHLAQLERADLVREKTRMPELEFMFKHSLTQEAAYNSLLVERRKDFHRRVGEALEQLFPDRRDEFLGLLAHHFDAAGERDKAIDYWIRAGDQQRMGDALVEAIQSYRRAVELLAETDDLDRAIKTWLKLGLVYQLDFQFEEAHSANETAFALEREARTRRPPSPATSNASAHSSFRLLSEGGEIGILDPSRTTLDTDNFILRHLFLGLAEFDSETNVVPAAARSWEVLDGGTRFVFHLRDDMRWTDGNPVTAMDFEWTWKHNLAPGASTAFPAFLDDIAGARDYREGRNPDPEQVGVRALDPFTLEVRLAAPVAYFLYLVTQPVTYALPRGAIERYGDEWWKPEHIVSDGPFQLVEFGKTHGRLKRRADYSGRFPGNVDNIQWRVPKSSAEALQMYRDGSADCCLGMLPADIPSEVPAGERIVDRSLVTTVLILIPKASPLADLRVRRAIAHGIDWQRIADVRTAPGRGRRGGGLVPPGMAGHSPEIGLPFDLELAHRLLAEAGYPGGKNLRALKYCHSPGHPPAVREELRRQFADHLGITLEMTPITADRLWWSVPDPDIFVSAWAGDYPDPDNFLRQSSFYIALHAQGWHDPHFDPLLEAAARTPDRARRLAMYREADRLLVNDLVLVLPLDYGDRGLIALVKPWVKGLHENALGQVNLGEITIEPHGP